MPEKGWAILTVREDTARKAKERAHAQGLTVDEIINQLMNEPRWKRWMGHLHSLWS